MPSLAPVRPITQVNDEGGYLKKKNAIKRHTYSLGCEEGGASKKERNKKGSSFLWILSPGTSSSILSFGSSSSRQAGPPFPYKHLHNGSRQRATPAHVVVIFQSATRIPHFSIFSAKSSTLHLSYRRLLHLITFVTLTLTYRQSTKDRFLLSSIDTLHPLYCIRSSEGCSLRS